MSYILEALKRADAERGRGTVPGLHAYQFSMAGDALEARSPWTWRLIITFFGATLVLGGLALHGRWPAVPGSTLSAVAAARPDAPERIEKPEAPAVAREMRGEPLAEIQASPLPVQPQVRRVVARETAVAEKVEAPAPGRHAAPVAKASPPMNEPARPLAASNTATAGASTTSTAPETSRYADLPEDVRKQIPAMAINGAVYSESTREWILLVNDRLVTRGSPAAPDVRLEEVSTSSATFGFRGYRFRVDF